MDKNENIRAMWHDYNEAGYYLITMVTDGRQRLFGTIVGMWDDWKPQDGSTANHSQRVPDWFRRDYAELLTAVSGDMQEVYERRCLIAALWPNRPRSMKAGKADCEVMNEVARTIQDVSAPSGGNTA